MKIDLPPERPEVYIDRALQCIKKARKDLNECYDRQLNEINGMTSKATGLDKLKMKEQTRHRTLASVTYCLEYGKPPSNLGEIFKVANATGWNYMSISLKKLDKRLYRKVTLHLQRKRLFSEIARCERALSEAAYMIEHKCPLAKLAEKSEEIHSKVNEPTVLRDLTIKLQKLEGGKELFEYYIKPILQSFKRENKAVLVQRRVKHEAELALKGLSSQQISKLSFNGPKEFYASKPTVDFDLNVRLAELDSELYNLVKSVRSKQKSRERYKVDPIMVLRVADIIITNRCTYKEAAANINTKFPDAKISTIMARNYMRRNIRSLGLGKLADDPLVWSAVKGEFAALNLPEVLDNPTQTLEDIISRVEEVASSNAYYGSRNKVK